MSVFAPCSGGQTVGWRAGRRARARAGRRAGGRVGWQRASGGRRVGRWVALRWAPAGQAGAFYETSQWGTGIPKWVSKRNRHGHIYVYIYIYIHMAVSILYWSMTLVQITHQCNFFMTQAFHNTPPGSLLAGPFWAPSVPCGHGPSGLPWALMGRALMGLPRI